MGIETEMMLTATLQKDGLLEVHVGDVLKKYIPGSHVFADNTWKNMIDVFGVYQGTDGRYCFFITDSERGIPEYSDVFETEEEACEALIKKMARSERLFQQYNKNKRNHIKS